MSLAPSTSDIELEPELIEFTKSFVSSAEQAFAALENISKVAETITMICGVLGSINSKRIRGIITSIDQVWRETQRLRIEAVIRKLPNDDFFNEFRKVFVSTAIEIYYTFKFQLLQIYLKVNTHESKLLALQKLGEYAGGKCFEQLLETESIENLHIILVPSIRRSSGYVFKDVKPGEKTIWKKLKKKLFGADLSNSVKNKAVELLSYGKSKVTEKLRFISTETASKAKKTTTFNFYNDCIPCFYQTHIRVSSQAAAITVGDEKGPTSSIAMDKIKATRRNYTDLHLRLRPGFENEYKSIKDNNLQDMPTNDSTLAERLMKRDRANNLHLIDKLLETLNKDNSTQLKELVKLVDDIPTRFEELFKPVHDVPTRLEELVECFKDFQNEVLRRKEKPDRVWFVNSDPQNFVARRKEDLDAIWKKIVMPVDRPTIKSQTKIISGLGGVGKTITAREFIEKFAEDNSNCNVVVLDAQTHDSLNEDFHKLAKQLKLLEDPEKFDWELEHFNIFERICDRECLLVFDNAESMITAGVTRNGIKAFLPASLPPERTRNLLILVTTRNPLPESWEDNTPILLNVLSDDESIKFVKNELGKNPELYENKDKDEDKDADIKKLCKLCGNLPLALFLTAEFVKKIISPVPDLVTQ